MKKTFIQSSYVPVLVGLLGIGALGFSSCKKTEEEPPPPAPSAAPAPPPAPEPVAVAVEEEAGPPVEDAAVKKVAAKSAPADVAGLRACCTALRQNAASMPAPNNSYAVTAATACDAFVQAVAAGANTRAGALGSINSIMKGANLPPACK